MMSHKQQPNTSTSNQALTSVLRTPAEEQYAQELEELSKLDRQENRACPPNWRLSPWGVRRYLLGEKLPNGFTVTTKYIGNPRVVEGAIATLRTDRALLLYGVPGTAKSFLSEHLAAAISGDSTLVVQGTAGKDEPALSYNWNYALLLMRGMTEEALVPSPLMRAMQLGTIVRVEELTRLNSEVQDALISPLSEKTLAIPELNMQVRATMGFNLIATANNRDKGVNELSSALLRRFNTITLPLPASLEEEVKIVEQRVASISKMLALPGELPALQEIQRIVTIFRDLRSGVSQTKRIKVRRPSGTLSPAEAISVVIDGMSCAACFRGAPMRDRDCASGLVGAVVKDPQNDKTVFEEYLRTALKGQSEWEPLYNACMEVLQ